MTKIFVYSYATMAELEAEVDDPSVRDSMDLTEFASPRLAGATRTFERALELAGLALRRVLLEEELDRFTTDGFQAYIEYDGKLYWTITARNVNDNEIVGMAVIKEVKML